MVTRNVLIYLTMCYWTSMVSSSFDEPPRKCVEFETISLRASSDDLRPPNSQLLYQAFREMRDDATPVPNIDVRVIGPAEVETFVWKYPDLEERMIIPLFGYACRVEKLRGENEFSDRLELKVLKGDWREKQYGDDLAIPLSGIIGRTEALPTETKEDRWMNGRYLIRVRSIHKEKRRCVAKLEFGSINRDKASDCVNDLAGQFKSPVLATGDTFVIPASLCVDEDGKGETVFPETKFLVTGIVEPDATQHILGWVTVRPLVKTWPQPNPN